MKLNLKKKQVLFILFGIILLLGTVTYAYFSAITDNNRNQEADLSTAVLALRFADRDNGLKAEMNFGDTVTKKFLIENTGTAEASLSLDWKNLVNTYLNGSLTYRLTYSETEDGEYKELIPKTNVPVSRDRISQAIASEISVPTGETYYYNLDITLNSTDVDQSADLYAEFNTEFDVGEPSKYRHYRLTVNPAGGEWNGHTTSQEYLLKNGETQDIPNPTRVGYTFTGWNVQGVSSSLEDTTFSMGITDTYLIAQWNRNSYSLFKNVNCPNSDSETSGTSSGLTPGGTSKLIILYQASRPLGQSPVCEGYTFTGWNITEGGGTITEDETGGYTFKLTEASNATVEAQWTPNNYKYIVYHNQMNIDGEGYTLVSADTDEGEAAYNSTVTPETKIYTGFTSPIAQTLTIKAETAYPPELNKIDYNYERNKYDFSICPGDGRFGGARACRRGELHYQQTNDLNTIQNVNKTGYNFSGWEITLGNGTLTEGIFTMGTEASRVDATFTPKEYSVTFNANGGTVGTLSKTVTYDSTYGSLPEPTYSGYKFLGWFTEQDGGVQVTSNSTVSILDNQILYAHWEEKEKITIIIKANNETVTTYNNGTKTEMYAFRHDATEQTPAQTDYRYIGNTPNNYVTFNNETWRIIGVFETENGTGTTEERIKIIRNNSLGNIAWDTNNLNEWKTASLQMLLNGDYYNRAGLYTSTGLTAEARAMIEPAKWYLGGGTSGSNQNGPFYYNLERGTTVYSGRTTNFVGNVGLIYPSDYVYTYANGVDNKCYTDAFNCDSGTKTAGWMYNMFGSTNHSWVITPFNSGARYVLNINSAGHVGNYNTGVDGAALTLSVRPVVYLKSGIKLISGNGTQSNPYTLSS